MFDAAIIGTGPAGISAALTLKALNKSFLLFGNGHLSEKIRKAECIRNYPGLNAASGKQMKDAFANQLTDMGIVITEKTVTGVYHMGSYYGIVCNQEMFEAKTVILATGVASVKPIEGEEAFLGRGVSYCATCDGFLYKGKTIAVVCASREYEHEVDYLSELAAKVYFIPLYRREQPTQENVEWIRDMPLEVTGGQRVQQLRFRNQTVDVDGVFFLKSAVSPNTLVVGLETMDGHVVVTRDCATNLPGCFAAGDCTGRPYQYVKAAGEGNVAAHSAVRFLSEM